MRQIRTQQKSFRVGRVRADRRGKVWYLTYHESGIRHRPRVGPDKQAAKQLAAQINAQLEFGTPAALSFDPIPVAELRERWLSHHEQVLRSSVQTVCRYRTATKHLIDFLSGSTVAIKTSHFGARHAEDFTRYLRRIEVAPNGHPRSAKRPLLDKGVKYILEVCRSMFSYGVKRRHLSPYAENPFSQLDLDRIPVENSKPVRILTPDQERTFLYACDDWQFPIFLTLMLTGLRPGELSHLLLPEELDLKAGVVRVRNKAELGWQVKTRNEREIPLIGVHVDVLRHVLGERTTGPAFLRRRFARGQRPLLADLDREGLKCAILHRVSTTASAADGQASRSQWQSVAKSVWRDAGMIRPERIRIEFMRLTRSIGISVLTAPKSLRHLFATSLQDANVDPLIRCELMGHSTGSLSTALHGLGMTAHYTHTRAETLRRQLEHALDNRPATAAARERLTQ